MPKIRVHRGTGGFLETTLAEAELAQLRTIKDLKICLAEADENKPPRSLVQLFEPGKNKPRPDDAQMPHRVVVDPQPQSALMQYVVTDDVMSIIRREDISIPEGWPNTDDGREQPWKMFEPRVAEVARQIGYHVNVGFDGCKDFVDALKWMVLRLPEEKVNETYSDGSTLLSRICRCTIQWGKLLQAFEFDTLLLDFIKLDRLAAEVIDRSLRILGQEQRQLWLLPNGHELVEALIEKNAGRDFWAGCWWPHGDNLLQHILDPVYCWQRRTDAAGRLCLMLAERFSLPEFCHLNDNGFCALNYTAGLVEQAAKMGEQEGKLWWEVMEAIKANMVRRFQDNPGRVEVLGLYTDRIWKNSYNQPNALEVLKAFEEDLRRRVTEEKWQLHDVKVSKLNIDEQIADVLDSVCKMHKTNRAAASASKVKRLPSLPED